MDSPTDIVLKFNAACAKDRAAADQAFRTYFAPDGYWDNVGMMVTTGPEEHIALLDHFRDTLGLATFDNEILHIAATGNTVLTERIDHLYDADGNEKFALRIMGVFEVENGKITAWRDYFDTTAFRAAVG